MPDAKFSPCGTLAVSLTNNCQASSALVFTTEGLSVTTVQPSLASMQGGTPLTITGPCFVAVANEQALCRLISPDETIYTFPAQVFSSSQVICTTPLVSSNGFYGLSVSMDNGITFSNALPHD